MNRDERRGNRSRSGRAAAGWLAYMQAQQELSKGRDFVYQPAPPKVSKPVKPVKEANVRPRSGIGRFASKGSGDGT